ncbi:GNAT family N-acetyltransferase [Saccharibacillus sp. CPCC 101409]|uniref:GNAT family N-acetyltransferase n=1 Tax=Saccharibacillus sp. CPCC 101409 TaxID=3058041 RepID=UPI002671FED9|nr:GNAT family N-acetyltransferase [Saccharibacillus sp. CPCC 101409]MDO3413062.1 GNAT family N-acetyltransferase [Saccharibacillus sp. CPCC 101409]
MLNAKQLDDIKDLQRLCERTDGIQLKLNDELLKMDNRSELLNYFCHKNDKLVGFLALYGFGSQFEVCGMVHPDYRRQGIFTNLWNEAAASGALNDAESILLNAPRDSNAAARWLKTIRCRLSFSEHEMKWHEDEAQENRRESDISVSYRPFEPEDRGLIVRLYADGFDMSESDVLAMLDEENGTAAHTRRMIVHRGETVGTLVMNYDTAGQSGIFGLVVDPSCRGQGIGRSMLKRIIRSEHERGQEIYIGVETQNENALHLYESCGFRSYAVQDYYKLQL